MILALVIIIAVLIIALWLSSMALWWQTDQGLTTKTLKRDDAVQAWNKAARLARRSWYNSLRHSQNAARWSNKKVTNVFIAVFPKSKSAFVEQDMMTGLSQGPSSYFLANLTRTKSKAASAKATAPRRKKPVTKESENLSV